MSEDRTPELAAAYAYCRAVAKREAKNFYWAFRALPSHKSDAMCAVYAFMRRADDLADEESMPVEARRAAMREWTMAWRHSRAERTSEPLFLALNDTQRRFGIPDELLEQLVAGTTMDLQTQVEGVISAWATTVSGESMEMQEYQVYENFAGLYRYCYLVASVVGLVTIRIFGYSNPEAERLAERTGIAFQLTNILRDVAEDAERGRIYLPLDDLARNNLSVEQFALDVKRGSPSLGMRGLLQSEVTRAQEFYRSGRALLPLIDRDAQPAMQVLVSIYHRLLDRIESNPSAVLHGRVSVPTAEKMAILVRGVVASFLARLT